MISIDEFYKIKTLSQVMSAEQIAEVLDLSPTTVRKWRDCEKWSSRRSSVKRMTKIGPYEPMICAALTKYQRYSARQMYQMIRKEGYEGKYTQVKEFVRSVRPKMQEAYLQITYPPGDSAQVDWGTAPGSYETDGIRRKAYFFVMTMCHSRKMYVEFTLGCAREHFDQCHRNAFEFFGAIPRRVIVDNCKTAVLENEKGKDPVINPAYKVFAAHYGFEIIPCTPYRPNEKGGVENGVKYVKGNFLNGYKPGLFEALNPDVKEWLADTANVRVHGTTERIPNEVHEEELSHLRPLPLHPYDCCQVETKRVTKFFQVKIDQNHYSVPHQYVGRDVNIHRYMDEICIYHDGKRIAQHMRCYGRNERLIKEEHQRDLLTQRRRARDSEYEQMFLKLPTQAPRFLQGLKEKRLKPIEHVRRIFGFIDIHGEQCVCQAITDALSWEAYDADAVLNIIESQGRLIETAGPLHVSHKADQLQVTLKQPDLSIYS